MIFHVSADEGMGKYSKLVEFWTSKLFQICACVISARKAKELDATTMFTYSHANTPLVQSERAYYLSYFIKCTGRPLETMFCQLYQIQGYHSQWNVRENQNSF